FLWAAAERLEGILYGEGTTSYKGHDPCERGQRRHLRPPLPGRDLADAGPTLGRDQRRRRGLGDREYRDRRHGIAAIRNVLGGTGLFSASAGRKGSTSFSWPFYSRDATTPRRIEAAKTRLLRLASAI